MTCARAVLILLLAAACGGSGGGDRMDVTGMDPAEPSDPGDGEDPGEQPSVDAGPGDEPLPDAGVPPPGQPPPEQPPPEEPPPEPEEPPPPEPEEPPTETTWSNVDKCNNMCGAYCGKRQGCDGTSYEACRAAIDADNGGPCEGRGDTFADISQDRVEACIDAIQMMSCSEFMSMFNTGSGVPSSCQGILN